MAKTERNNEEWRDPAGKDNYIVVDCTLLAALSKDLRLETTGKKAQKVEVNGIDMDTTKLLEGMAIRVSDGGTPSKENKGMEVGE